MATLRKPREEVSKAIAVRIQVGNDLKTSKAEIARKTGRHRDWLELFETWRTDTMADLNALYGGADIAKDFGLVTTVS